MSCSKDLSRKDVYRTLIVYGLLCGLGWIASGIIALIAFKRRSHELALTSIAFFSVLYTIFLFIFGSVWERIKKVEDDCPSFECDDYKKGIRRSARSFLGLSILALILILGSMACILASTFCPKVGEGSDPNAAPREGEPSPYDIQAQVKAHELMNVQAGQYPAEITEFSVDKEKGEPYKF